MSSTKAPPPPPSNLHTSSSAASTQQRAASERDDHHHDGSKHSHEESTHHQSGGTGGEHRNTQQKGQKTKATTLLASVIAFWKGNRSALLFPVLVGGALTTYLAGDYVYTKYFREEAEPEEPDLCPRVFFDVLIDGKDAGRMVFLLRPDVVPKAVRLVQNLCTGENATHSTYAGTPVNFILPGNEFRFGDALPVAHLAPSTAQGERAQGQQQAPLKRFGVGVDDQDREEEKGEGNEQVSFDDDGETQRHLLRHKTFSVSRPQGSEGVSGALRVCVTDSHDMAKLSNGKHTVIGRVVQGQLLARRIGRLGNFPNGRPSRAIIISRSGLLLPGKRKKKSPE